VLPGSALCSLHCPLRPLQSLDVSGCELVTEVGLQAVAAQPPETQADIGRSLRPGERHRRITAGSEAAILVLGGPVLVEQAVHFFSVGLTVADNA